MKRLLPHRVFAVVMVLLLALPLAATAAVQPSPSKSSLGWPMVGQNPARTGRSPLPGPLNPHLLWTHRGLFGPEMVGPDGSVYGWGNTDLVALNPQGGPLWTVHAYESFGGPPALRFDGALLVSGQLPVTATQDNTQPHVSIFAVSPQGHVMWAIRSLSWATVPHSVPFSKSTPPLISIPGQFYVPFVGPSYTRYQNNGVEVVSMDGQPLRRLLAGWGGPIAQSPSDGTIYELGYDYSGHTALLACRVDGVVAWQHYVSYAQTGSVLVGQGGTVYAGDGVGWGANNAAEVAAYTPSGQLLWRLATDGGVANLAERGDGVIMVADGNGLMAVSPHGKVLWHRALGRTPSGALPPSLAVDSAGYAYTGSADGKVRAITPGGTVLWTLSAGGPSTYNVPTIALGPGMLEVTGTDNVVRVYR